MPKPQVTESVGGTTTVNSDTHVQVWVVQIPQEGTYDIDADGKVNGYINPRLAFGHGSSYGWLTWVFGGLLALGVVRAGGRVDCGLPGRPRRRGRLRRRRLMSRQRTDVESRRLRPSPSYTPTDQGMRLEQLRQLAALRDSGALTEDEFEAEKRRILEN